MSTPVEAVPSIDKATMLSAIPSSPPGSNANFLNDSIDTGNDWKRSPWFAENSGFIIESRLALSPGTDSDSTWFYSNELGWVWTAASVYPRIYRSTGDSWNYFEASTNRIYNYGSLNWGEMQSGAIGVIPDWYSETKSYVAKDLVFLVRRLIFLNNQIKDNNPLFNPSYWKSLNTLAAALSAPVATVPNTSKTTLLTSLPVSTPLNRGNLWQGHSPLVGEWKNSSWFGTILELNNTNGWLFHTKLNFIYTDSVSKDSVWFFKPEMGPMKQLILLFIRM